MATTLKAAHVTSVVASELSRAVRKVQRADCLECSTRSKMNFSGHGSNKRSTTSPSSAARELRIKARCCRTWGQKKRQIRQVLGSGLDNLCGIQFKSSTLDNQL